MHVTYIHTDQEPAVSGANQENDAGSFQSLGEAADAVIMKLSSRLPRIRVKRARVSTREESRGDPL